MSHYEDEHWEQQQREQKNFNYKYTEQVALYEQMLSQQEMERRLAYDPVSHPQHYTSHPSGIECIQVTEHMNFNIGNAIKYCWRTGLKAGSDSIEDLNKAIWYINREIDRINKQSGDKHWRTYNE